MSIAPFHAELEQSAAAERAPVPHAGESLVSQLRSGRMSRRQLMATLGLAGIGAATAKVLIAAAGHVAAESRLDPLSAPPSSAPKPGGVLRLGGVAPGVQFDPPTFTDGVIRAVLSLATEHLVHTGPDGTIEPELAVEWAVAPDSLTWTFVLRPRVVFTDGSVLTAAAVVRSIERLVAPDSTSAAKGTFEGVLSRIEAVDDATVAFILARPFTDFPYLVSSTNFNTIILPDRYDGDWQHNPVGTGPLRITDLRVDERVTCERFEESWRADEIYVDGAVCTFYSDPQAVLLAFQGGEIDTTPIPDPAIAATLDPHQFGLVSAPSNGFNALALRVDTPPFDRVEVRQAIAWALDRVAINEVISANHGTIGNDHIFGPVHAVQPEGIGQRDRDLDKVAELLGGESVSFEITTVQGREETFATLLQQQLDEAGFEVTLNVLSRAEYYASGDTTPWLTAPATVTYWASRPSPSQLLGLLLTSTAVWNASHYANPHLDELAAAYDAAIDPAEKQAIANRLARILQEDVPVVIALFDGVNRGFATRVHGVVADPSLALNLSGVWLDA